MEKIKLADGTLFPIADYSSAKRIPIRIEGLTEAEILSRMTDDNLAEIRFLTRSGETFCVITNQSLRDYTIEDDVMIVDIDDIDLCKVALVLSEDGRIVDVVPIRYAKSDAVSVENLPEGDFRDYKYISGEYVYDPLPASEEENKPTQEDRIKALEEENAVLLECLLEMSEIVYA